MRLTTNATNGNNLAAEDQGGKDHGTLKMSVKTYTKK